MKSPENTNRPYKGLHTDSSPQDTPKDSYRMALNAVSETSTGDSSYLSNEGSNRNISTLPNSSLPMGDRYIGDGISVVMSVNGPSSYIGILDKNDVYSVLVDTQTLGFLITQQIDVRFRLRRGGQRVIYWVDGYHRARSFNLDRVEQYYSQALNNWLAAGNPISTFVGEKFDGSAFDLIKGYDKIPRFEEVEILTYGSILPGSYNFAIQYLDDNLNPTEWIATSNTVNIFNDSLDRPYHRIRGSRNLNTDSQNFPRASKSIKLTLTNLDTNFPFYRIAVIQAVSNNGKPTRALTGSISSTQSPIFIYSGNDADLSEVSLQDIEIDGELILAPNHIEQIENRLILGNTKSSEYDWCKFQKYASQITSDLVTKEVVLNSVDDTVNQKNPYSTFMYRGYMPGEAYSFGAIYVMKDGSISPVCHIPGKHSSVVNNMAYHELDDTYINLHTCIGANQYWGADSTGHGLTGSKIRHHKFKSRRELSKPLIQNDNTTVTITKYRLAFKVSLNPGKLWPLDSSGIPKIIGFTVNYKPSYATSPIAYTGYITIDDLNQEKFFYDDIYPPTNVTIAYQEFDPACELITTYQPIGNETFTITPYNDSYVASTTNGVTTSEIFGINFSNIKKPHPDVIGFYIVRNEREDDDRIVVDNAIIGENTKSGQYSTFGLFMPKNEDSKKDTKATWFFSPEHQFLRKTPNFTSISVQGLFQETSKTLGPRSYSGTGVYPNVNPFGNNNRGIRGVLIEDVYSGTSYNSDIHTKNSKDDDGFSLAIGYRNFSLGYFVSPSSVTLPTLDKVFYLDAAANKLDGSTVYYNASCDNKIGIMRFSSDINLSNWVSPLDATKSRLIYASLLTDNRTSYYDFLTRDYFKEHNNIVLFNSASVINNHQVFNGDAFISPASLTSTVFWEQRIADREKKNKTWQIIVGAALIVAGVAITVITAGGGSVLGVSLTAAGAATLTGLAVAYGVSLAMSGIKFEQMKNMIDNDYPKGLKEALKDQDNVYALDGDETYPGPQPSGTYPNDTNGQTDDDMFMWWADRLSGTWIESTIPYAIRVGLTSGASDFIDAPNPQFEKEEFESYLTEKLTTLDKDRGSGRLYRGYPTSEIYDANLDYMRFNKEKTFIHLPAEYDCCYNNEGASEEHPMRVWYSEQSFQEEKMDNYAVFLPNSYRDIEGEHGEITNLFRLGNSLYIQTREALWHLPQNVQERVTSEVISFIGTGDFFSIPPRKVVDDSLGSGGSRHKWASVKTDQGMFILDENQGKVLLYGDGFKTLSSIGMYSWFKENLRPFLATQLYDTYGVVFKNVNNPANPSGTGYLSAWDTRYKRVLITKKDYLLLPNALSSLTFGVPQGYTAIGAFPPVRPPLKFNDGIFYSYHITPAGVNAWNVSPYPLILGDPDFFESKCFTLSYNIEKESWISFHSYLPSYYIYNQDTFYSFNFSSSMWRHNEPTSFQTFYGAYKPFIVESIAVSSPLDSVVWEDVSFMSEGKAYDTTSKQWVDKSKTFNKVIFSNSRQSSGEQMLIVKEDESPSSYLHNQITDRVGAILLTRKERSWNLNDIRDYRIDYTVPIFSSSWDSIKNYYWIDKVLNTTSISFSKSWTQLEPMRDTWMSVRFALDDSTQSSLRLTYNYIVNTSISSPR